MSDCTLELPLFAPEFDPKDERLPQRFQDKFEIRDVPRHHLAEHLGPCWIWVAAMNGRGYGDIWRKPRVIRAHIFSYEALVSPMPKGYELDHLCRNTECCNPAHLQLVTHQENMVRGVSPPAINALKTHCKNGHPFSGDNLCVYSNGFRQCLTCRRNNVNEKRRRERELRAALVLSEEL